MEFAEENLSFDELPRNVIQKLMDDIYEAVGLRVTMVDRDGERMALSDPQTVRCIPAAYIPDFEGRCAACREEVERRAREKDGVYIYRCWRGLMSAFAPIRVEGEYLGRLEISVFVSTPESMAQAEQIHPEPLYTLSEEEMKDYPFLYRERVADTISIIRIAANYLTELYRRQKAERLQAKAEFKALQSQIRPHFLFNTLNSISQMALLEGAEQAPEAIYSLAGILRRTMKQTTQMVPLSEELLLVSDYVRIKQLTGRETLRYSEEVEPGLERMLLPPLCIQPLVENAITHGLEINNRGGSVRFTGRKNETHVVLSVTDDGVGFEMADLREDGLPHQCAVNSVSDGDRSNGQVSCGGHLSIVPVPTDTLSIVPVPTDTPRNDREGGEMSGIGLANVVKRLESFFGVDFHYDILSSPGQGTRIELHIPRDKAGV